MSLAEIRPYFRERIKTIDPEMREWTNAVNEQNIPNTVIKKRYHIEIGAFTQTLNNQGVCLELTGQTTVRLWGAKGVQPQNAFDTLILKGQSLIKEILRASNRVTQPGLKDVRLTSFEPLAFDPTNDNLIELVLIFDLTIILELPKGDI